VTLLPFSHAELVADLRARILSVGILTDARFVFDGKLHRFHVDGDHRGDKSGWYVVHEDGIPAGAFGCFRLGISEKWLATLPRDQCLLPVEREALRRARERREDEAEQRARARAERATRRAETLWNRAAPADPDHPYLNRKRLAPGRVRQLGSALVIPVRGADGRLYGLQFIQPNSEKKFMAGTVATGSYFSGGALTDVLVVAEGWATAQTLGNATGLAWACAFSAGNLEAVARTLHVKYPAYSIVIAADNDRATERLRGRNPGLLAAARAAQAAGGVFVAPPFTDEDPETSTDWEDYAVRHGMAQTKEVFLASFAKKTLAKGAVSPRSGDIAPVSKGVTREAASSERMEQQCALWTLREWLAHPELLLPPPALVPRIAYAGRITLLAAREKIGKSTILAQMGVALTAGKPFLFGEALPLIPVLWYCLDEALADCIRRFRILGAGLDHLTITDRRPTAIEMAADIAFCGARLVVIDTLAELWRGRIKSENDADEIGRFLDPYVRSARETGVALVLPHHKAKSDVDYRGSGAIGAKVDIILDMRRQGRRASGPTVNHGDQDDEIDDGRRILEGRGRGVPHFVERLAFDGQEYSRGDALLSIEGQIIQVLGRSRLKMTGLRDEVRGRNEAISEAAHRLAANGRVRCVDGWWELVEAMPIGSSRDSCSRSQVDREARRERTSEPTNDSANPSGTAPEPTWDQSGTSKEPDSQRVVPPLIPHGLERRERSAADTETEYLI
jgi:putative DNA primase/helicase